MRYERGKRFRERLSGTMPLFPQVICATSGRNVRDEFGVVFVKRFFKRAKGIDDAVREWSGISGLADVVEGVVSAPFVDDQSAIWIGRYNVGDRDAIGDEMVCDFLFDGEQVVWFAARERCKEVVFGSKYRLVSRDFPDCVRPSFGERFDFCNALFWQFVAEQVVNDFGHGSQSASSGIEKINRGSQIDIRDRVVYFWERIYYALHFFKGQSLWKR